MRSTLVVGLGHIKNHTPKAIYNTLSKRQTESISSMPAIEKSEFVFTAMDPICIDNLN